MIKFRKANPTDYKRFAFIHTQAFVGFFLTTLGKGFLATYYLSCLKHKSTIAVCAYDEEDNIIGFASGSIWSKGYNKNVILANKLAFGFAALKIVLTRPLALARLINNLSKNNNKEDKGDYAELLSIAILPTYKGLGIGKQILIEFEKEAILQNSNKISLTTDFYNNEDIVKFYKKLGYDIFYDFITYPNRKMIKMIKQIT
jgi:ribosomal protein S18 acetylase RimI-like enzyme